MAEDRYGKSLLRTGEEGRNSGFHLCLIQQLLLCSALVFGYNMCLLGVEGRGGGILNMQTETVIFNSINFAFLQ